ncbi:MAG: MFS transporter [Burkholderiaceae bacterium]|nr:MFS transporter [Burkholderiaceae bacterium]
MTKASSKIRFTSQEWRACLALSMLYGLRMLGLFLVFPVLAAESRGLAGGTDPVWVGIAVGVYGLTQAMLQIPFGMASDRYGRRRVILVGLGVFALGSFVAAVASSIAWLSVGRALQGAGAISAAVTAFLADSTRDEVRTRAMAMIGGTIGLAFALSLIVAPALSAVMGMSGLFWMTGLLVLMAMIPVVRMAEPPRRKTTDYSMAQARKTVLTNGQLMRLNFGIFMIHMTQTAIFVVVPLALIQMGLALPEHWQVYLPVVLLSFGLMIAPIFWAERTGKNKPAFLAAIALMGASILGFAVLPQMLWVWMAVLLLFFTSFNVLEAFLPSWVSRIAPPEHRGLALGVYNTTQSLGLFSGGLLGGAMTKAFGPAAVYWACAATILVWGMISFGLKELGPRTPRPA